MTNPGAGQTMNVANKVATTFLVCNNEHMTKHGTSAKPYTRKMGPAVVNLDGIDTNVPMIELLDEISGRAWDAVERLCSDGQKMFERWEDKQDSVDPVGDWADKVARSMDKRSK